VVVLKEGSLVAFDTPTALKRRTGSSSLEEAFARLTRQAVHPPEEPRPA